MAILAVHGPNPIGMCHFVVPRAKKVCMCVMRMSGLYRPDISWSIQEMSDVAS